jgi:hypothetical protein
MESIIVESDGVPGRIDYWNGISDLTGFGLNCLLACLPAARLADDGTQGGRQRMKACFSGV